MRKRAWCPQHPVQCPWLGFPRSPLLGPSAEVPFGFRALRPKMRQPQCAQARGQAGLDTRTSFSLELVTGACAWPGKLAVCPLRAVCLF